MSAAALPRPQPLPASLEPFFELIARLARNERGYCFARTESIGAMAGYSRVHAWRKINRLAAFGRVRIVPIPGSHERRLYPRFFRPPVKRSGNEEVTKKAHTTTSGQATPELQQTDPTSTPAPPPAPESESQGEVVVPAAYEKKTPESLISPEPVKAFFNRAQPVAVLESSLEKSLSINPAADPAAVEEITRHGIASDLAQQIAAGKTPERCRLHAAAALAYEAKEEKAGRAACRPAVFRAAFRGAWTPPLPPDPKPGPRITKAPKDWVFGGGDAGVPTEAETGRLGRVASREGNSGAGLSPESLARIAGGGCPAVRTWARKRGQQISP